MANLNKVLLMGNLTRDIEMRFTPSGMGVAKFGIAINRKFRDSKSNEMREEVTFVELEAWGKTAETMHKYLSKGKPVFIEGRLRLDQWDDKATGAKRSKMLVVVDNFQFIAASGQGGQGGQGSQSSQGGGAPRSAYNAAPRNAPPQPSHDDMGGGPDSGFDGGGGGGDDLNIPEENIPF